jgi:RNA polymerase sigma-70 factor (ECF subfamily)
MNNVAASVGPMGNVPFAPECESHLSESGTLAFRVALSVLRHREDAEDVAQEAVVRSLQRFNSLRDRARFRSWLVRVTWRLALDRRRTDTRRNARDLYLVPSEASHGTAEHELIQSERAGRLWAAIDDLPPRLRQPLILGTLQGRSVEEVASLLRVPVGTVKSRSHEARRRLKKTLMAAGVISAGIVAVMLTTWLRVESRVTPPVIAAVTATPSIDVGHFTDARIAAGVTRPVARTAPAVVVAADVATVPAPLVAADAALAGMATNGAPTIEIAVVETRVVRLPTVHLPVVDVPIIEVPAVRTVPAGSSEAHPEKQR